MKELQPLSHPLFLYRLWHKLRNNVQELRQTAHVTAPPPTPRPSQSECFEPVTKLPSVHPTPTAPRVRLRLFFSQRGQCGCALRPDWLRAAGLRAQALAAVTKGGSPARAPAACGVSGSGRRILASPAMPNRRTSRNAYYFFVQEKIPDLRRRGLPVARVADAIPYCSADWAVRREGVGGGKGAQGVDQAVGQVQGRDDKERGLKETRDPVPPAGGKGRPRVPALGQTKPLTMFRLLLLGPKGTRSLLLFLSFLNPL